MYLDAITIKEKVELDKLQGVLIEKQKVYLAIEEQEQYNRKNGLDDPELAVKMQVAVKEVDDAGKALANYKALLKAEYQG